jgi:cytochrome P450
LALSQDIFSETAHASTTYYLKHIRLALIQSYRLREETRTSLSTDQPISATSIERLPYLQAFTSEVLRLYPPVPATIRQAVRPTSILSTPIPKGTYVMLFPWAINTNKSAWGPDARTFDPSRWLEFPNGGAPSNYSTLTFLHGPRSCIGEKFARGEFACLLAAWVGAWETELEDPGAEIKIDMTSEITAKPKGGLRVRLRAVR